MFDWLTPGLIEILWKCAQAVIILLALVLTAAWMIWLERRLLGLWQDRYGPNRVGPFGLGQVVADMIKIFFKEDWTPPFVDKPMFWLAPVIAMSMMMLSFSVIPITENWGVSNLEYGLLYFFAFAGLAVYAVMLAGWSSNSKYALLGGLRSAAQTISYEVFMGIAAMGVVMQAGSFNLRDIVEAQQQGWWNIIPQFVGFWLFAMAAVASVHRTPFDLPEAEAELAAGYHTEYSGMKFGMFFVGEYVGIVMASALLVALFFGGWDVPFMTGEGPVLQFLSFAAKTFIFMSIFILLRAALPRPRYDHIMSAAWKFCLPLALLNMLVTGLVVVARSQGV